MAPPPGARPATGGREPGAAALAATPGAGVLGRSTILCSVSVELPAGELAGLLDRVPSVARILPHGERRSLLDVSVPTIGASTWTGAGYDGSSATKVAVMDTGIDSGHPALSGPVQAEAVFLDAGALDAGFADDANSTDDYHGHGTHVGGIVMSTDSQNKGVAPGGFLIDAKCGYRLLFEGNYYGSLQDADIMAAGDWAAAQGADAVNASFGGDDVSDASTALSHFFEALVDDLGVFAAVAAGNSGPTASTVLVPGDAYNVLTTGSLDDKGTSSHTDNVLSSFSSRGPLDDGRRKPDLCAPGTAIASCNAGWEGGDDFVSSSGTSMATPHVAGAAALLFDYGATWRPEGVKALLASTARNTTPYPSAPDNNWGAGGMDLAAAFTSRASVAEGVIKSSGLPFAFVRSGKLTAGKRATLCWNREVLENGVSAPSTYRVAADLDLYLYEEADFSALGSSTGALGSSEQAKATAASNFPVLKIRLEDGFPAGQTEVRWAVATEATTASMISAPPTLRCEFSSLPDLVRGGEEFTVEATLTNDGDLPAFDPVVTLFPPPGTTLVEGGNPRTVVTLIGGGFQRVVTWTLRHEDGANGIRSFVVEATSQSFGETFNALGDAAEQDVDSEPPIGFLTVAGGAAAVRNTSVTLQVLGFDNQIAIDSMRFRNEGEAWGPWIPYAFTSPWTLAAGEGIRTVEAELRDLAGNVSGILSDTVLLDMTAPVGAVSVNGGAPYAMPWEELTADGEWSDGEGGSGVASFRHRWSGGGWSAGDDVAEPLPLSRPAAEGGILLEVEYLDGAGNASAPASDSIELVGEAPPLLNAVKKWSGTLDAGGDVDSFRIGLLPGDLLTVKPRLRSSVRKGEAEPLLDLFDPAEAKVVDGRWPPAARKPGIAKFEATLPGDHWLVLRAGGADGMAGGEAGLSVKVKRVKARAKAKGEAIPADGIAEIPFEAVTGCLLSGSLGGGVAGEATLARPDGSEVPLPLEAKGEGWTIPPKFLAGGAGTYAIRVPATGPVPFSLRVTPPRTGKVDE